MSEQKLHIVAFDIPYPPNYGGVIDVYYKLKELHSLGVKISLHCFEYPGRPRSEELNKICKSVYYYPRKTSLKSAISFKPYIVNSRRSEELIKNLQADDAPILFEGLHSCYYIDNERLKDRFKIYRESNIEHHYYFHLFLSDKNLLHKLYYLLTAPKLWLFQKRLKKADMILAVTQKDTDYMRDRIPTVQTELLHSLHGNNKVECKPGKGNY
ncbi:MAG: glycosyltransferase family 1 protein, partial [Bacteroidales bacterium]|nr:glycosyltransferase family 1 protein [Bacteroidales bacterium]